MKTILLLGGFGFIGCNVLRYIDDNLRHQYNVIVFDKVQQHPFGLKFECVKMVYSGDFSDITLIQNIFDKHKIDHVFHFISSTVPATSGNTRFDIESNLVPTVGILELLVKANVKNILYLSSGGAIYGNSRRENCESDNNCPISSYGIVKLSIEKYLLMFKEQYGLHPLILRLSNPFGAYHYSMKQGVVNVALRSAIENKEFTVWGGGDGKKDYIYIEDVVGIIFNLIEMNVKNEIINVGSGSVMSVNEIVNAVKNVIPTFNCLHKEAKSFDVAEVRLDISRLKSILGSFKFTPFDAGLQKTLDWLTSEQNRVT